MPAETELTKHTEYPRYHAYLLRLWQEQPGTQWRVMLQEVEGDRQWGFSDAAQCFVFVQQQLREERKEGDIP